LLKDIGPSDSYYRFDLTSLNGSLFFSANDGTHGYQLWTSNGTTAGTFRVTDLSRAGTTGPTVNNLANMNGTLFFTATDVAHGSEPWIVVPSAASAARNVASFSPGAIAESPLTGVGRVISPAAQRDPPSPAQQVHLCATIDQFFAGSTHANGIHALSRQVLPFLSADSDWLESIFVDGRSRRARQK
jgi:ELWxxDGT repeat protein